MHIFSTELIGIAGATIILFSFVLLQLKIWKVNFFWYDLFNFLGGLLLIFYAYLNHTPPFLILNIIWTTLSLHDVLSKKERRTRFFGRRL